MRIAVILLILLLTSAVVFLLADPMSILRPSTSQKQVVCFSGGDPIFSGVAKGEIEVTGDSSHFFSIDLGSVISFTNARCMFVDSL